MAIEINGSVYATDNEGFLLDPSDWDLNVAKALARGEQLDMSDDHWSVVHFVRNWYEERHAVPEARHALKDLRRTHGKGRGKPRASFFIHCFLTATDSRPVKLPACASRLS